MKTITCISVLFLFLTAAFSDLKDGKIQNRLIIFGLASYLLCAVFRLLFILKAFGGQGISFLFSREIPKTEKLVVSVSCCLSLLAFWKLRLIGGGDVKLFWLLFLFLPGNPGIFCFLLTFVIAFPAALYGLFTGGRSLRLGGAMFLSVIVYSGLEVGLI